MTPTPKTPAQEWEILAARIHSQPLKGFRQGKRDWSDAGHLEAGLIRALLDEAEKLADDIRNFMLAQIEEAKAHHQPQNGKPAGQQPAQPQQQRKP